MNAIAEIENRFDTGGHCNDLLYTPISEDVGCRIHRVYEFAYEGDAEAWRAFVVKVLADPVRDLVHDDGKPAVTDYKFYIDYGLKPGCLDLEKEYLLRFYRELETPGFTLTDLRIVHRVYVLGDLDPDRLVKDLINPVIHTWNVHHAV